MTSEKTPVTTIKALPKSVCVYANGCFLSCVGHATLTKGTNDLHIDCLPKGVSEDSLRAMMPTGVSLLSISIERPDEKEVDALAEESTQRMLDVQREIDALTCKLQTRQQQKEKWLSPDLFGQTSTDFSAIEGYLDNLSVHLDQLDKEMMGIRNQIAMKKKEYANLHEQDEKERSRIRRGVVLLKVDSEIEGDGIPFEIKLRSSQAKWTPIYDAYVDDFESPVRLKMRAEVFQCTGYDWDDVKMNLSTTAPSHSGSLPVIVPERLSLLAPATGGVRHADMSRRRMYAAPAMAKLEGDTVADEDYGDNCWEDMDEELLTAIDAPLATASSLANSVEYDIPGTWSVPDDDSALIEIQVTTIPSHYEWHAVPILDNSVYILAVLDKTLDSQAIGHEVSIHLSGEYCGKTVMEMARPDKPNKLSLGPDARMHAFRKLVDSVTEKAMLSKQQSEEKSYEVGVTSEREGITRLVMYDRIPVSQDKSIKVETKLLSGGKVDEETGEICWEVKLEEPTQVVKRFSYVVSWPKNQTLSHSTR